MRGATADVPSRVAPLDTHPAPSRVPRLPGSHRDEEHRGECAVGDAVSRALSAPSKSLDPQLQETMGRRFGHDFSHVRIHNDASAAESARLVGARAFTVGQQVVFGASRYEPGSSTGRQLLCHELAHTIQQRDADRGGGSPVLDRVDPGLDDEADRAASDHDSADVQGHLNTPTLQRQAGSDAAFDLTLTYPPAQTEHHRALAPAAALTVLSRFASRIEAHIAGAREGHRYLHEIHDDQWIVAGISDVLGGRSIPPLEIWVWPESLLRMARASIARGVIPQAARELQMAAQVTRSAEQRVYEYREGTIAGAERAVFGLEVVQVASTAVVTVGTGGTAGVLAGAALTGAQRLAGEATAVHLGLQQEIDWAGIGFDTIFAAVAGRFAGRLGSAVAARLTARIGSRVAAEAITAVVIGRASGIVHAGTRELFDALRGRTSLTLEQFIDRLADQLTARAAFLDLVGYAAASATARPAGPAAPPARSESETAALRPVQGGAPGRVAMRDGKVLSTPRLPPGGVISGPRGSAAPALDPFSAPETAPAPALREVPMPVAEPASATSNALPAAPSAGVFSGVAVASTATSTTGGAPTARPPFVLRLPREKAPHLATYRSWLGRLQSDPFYDRGSPAQLEKWHQAHRIGGSHGIPSEVYERGHAIGFTGEAGERRIRVPNWSWTRSTPMEVDHIIELQVAPADMRDAFDAVDNYELLDRVANGASGPRLRGNIARERATQVAHDPSAATRVLVFDRVDLGDGQDGERWSSEEIRAGEQLDAYEAFP